MCEMLQQIAPALEEASLATSTIWSASYTNQQAEMGIASTVCSWERAKLLLVWIPLINPFWFNPLGSKYTSKTICLHRFVSKTLSVVMEISTFNQWNKSKTCLSLKKKELKRKSYCIQLNKGICVGCHVIAQPTTNRQRNTRGGDFYNFLSYF